MHELVLHMNHRSPAGRLEAMYATRWWSAPARPERHSRPGAIDGYARLEAQGRQVQGPRRTRPDDHRQNRLQRRTARKPTASATPRSPPTSTASSTTTAIDVPPKSTTRTPTPKSRLETQRAPKSCPPQGAGPNELLDMHTQSHSTWRRIELGGGEDPHQAPAGQRLAGGGIHCRTAQQRQGLPDGVTVSLEEKKAGDRHRLKNALRGQPVQAYDATPTRNGTCRPTNWPSSPMHAPTGDGTRRGEAVIIAVEATRPARKPPMPPGEQRAVDAAKSIGLPQQIANSAAAGQSDDAGLTRAERLSRGEHATAVPTVQGANRRPTARTAGCSTGGQVERGAEAATISARAIEAALRCRGCGRRSTTATEADQLAPGGPTCWPATPSASAVTERRDGCSPPRSAMPTIKAFERPGRRQTGLSRRAPPPLATETVDVAAYLAHRPPDEVRGGRADPADDSGEPATRRADQAVLRRRATTASTTRQRPSVRGPHTAADEMS